MQRGQEAAAAPRRDCSSSVLHPRTQPVVITGPLSFLSIGTNVDWPEGQSEGGVRSIDFGFHVLKFFFFFFLIFYLEILCRSELFYLETSFASQIWMVKGHRYLIVFSLFEYMNECVFKFGTWGVKDQQFRRSKGQSQRSLVFLQHNMLE